jgi:acyl-CoA synthetase (AMP-forming)/AMP-acid ligase II
MCAEWLLERFQSWADRPALIWNDRAVRYGELLAAARDWNRELERCGIGQGRVVALHADYSPQACALLVALIRRGAVVVPLTPAAATQGEAFSSIAEVQDEVVLDTADHWQIRHRGGIPSNSLTRRLVETGSPGLVLFSSGSTGRPKATLHNFDRFLRKFEPSHAAYRTLAMPLFDHVAGLDTLFYTLSSGGTLICTAGRDPEHVCQAIERHQVELLPASPTFLNLLLLCGGRERADLSSIRIVAYGSEPMPSHTLDRLREMMPAARLIQKYGMTELGSPATRSRADESLWVKLESPGLQTRVVDGVLWVRSESAMLGYLNAPSPFDDEGWMCTEDMVEVEGEYVRFLGRRTEIISVGGQKVYPAEVEDVLSRLPNVRSVVVYGERNAIMGQTVAARVTLQEPEELASLKQRLRGFCKDKLEPFKVPVKVEVSDGDEMSDRFKKTHPVLVEA